jgi:hypothetical protein
MDWVDLSQDMVQLPPLVNTAINHLADSIKYWEVPK